MADRHVWRLVVSVGFALPSPPQERFTPRSHACSSMRVSGAHGVRRDCSLSDSMGRSTEGEGPCEESKSRPG
ncbi:hypothetical protein HDV57DRAFT_496138, partial [Trichoderma longibrachiatum]